MIIHSIVLDETIYAGIDKIQVSEEILVNGVLMEVERLENNQVRIIRLHSPELQHYMNNHYTPGQIISFQPYS